MQQSCTGIIEKLTAGYTGDGEILAFIEKVGPTAIGVKPASLINVNSRALEFCKQRLYGGTGGVSYTIVKRHGDRVQLFIYHRECLTRILSDAKMSNCLGRLGYPTGASVDILVQLLIGKIQGNVYPHEIGLFLGYPIKDVYGFMGAPIPYRKTMGWRMYGDVRLSERLYYAYKNARNDVRNMLNQACCDNILRS